MASCCGLILAGGLSTRMGTDKAQLYRNQQTMLEYSQSLLESLGLEILVSGGDKGLPDIVHQAGPLGGIYSAINQHQLEGDALLILPVDMPLLTPQVLQQLVGVGEASGSAVCYQGCYLPLYLPVNTALIDYLKKVFPSEALGVSIMPRSINRMLAAVGVTQLHIADDQVLSNANTPEEWRTIKSLIVPEGGEHSDVE